MKVWVLLADHAQGEPGQKLNAVGLGWSRTRTPLDQFFLVIVFETSPGEMGIPQKLFVRLVSDYGVPAPGWDGRPLRMEVNIAQDRNPVHSLVPAVTPINIGLPAGLPLEPGVYKWEVSDPEFPGQTWDRSFEVLPSA